MDPSPTVTECRATKYVTRVTDALTRFTLNLSRNVTSTHKAVVKGTTELTLGPTGRAHTIAPFRKRDGRKVGWVALRPFRIPVMCGAAVKSRATGPYM